MYTYKYPHPAIAVDCIVFAHSDKGVYILLIERRNNPYKGCWAFPGGFMNIDESAEDAAIRELKEETGLCVSNIHQVGAFSKVDRDPRERVVSIVFYAETDTLQPVKGSDDAINAQWFSLASLPQLAFDHKEILEKTLMQWSSEQ